MDLASLIGEECKRRHVPGVSVATIEDGRLARTSAFGVPEDIVFEAASMSKPVTAYVAMQVLDLDEPLLRHLRRSYLDDPRLEVVTARHAMTHQTGLMRDSSESAPYFERDPLIGFKYSNEGIQLLQNAVEDCAGRTLEELSSEMVFEPLGMSDSSFLWRNDYDASAATPHDEDGKPLEKNKPQVAWGPGGLHTTASDFARFVAAAPSLHDEWLTPQIEVHEVWGAGGPERGSTWGLGWGLQASDGSFWHWGWNIGFLSFAVGWPADRRGVVVFTNGQNGLWICKAVVRWFSGRDHPAFTWLEH